MLSETLYFGLIEITRDGTELQVITVLIKDLGKSKVITPKHSPEYWLQSAN